MELTSKRTIKNLLKKYLARPEKRLGQHFLVDEKVLRKIIREADLKEKDIVLEIGPGIGNLTQELAKRVKKVVAIEKDPKMVRILNNELRIKNIEIIQGDILKIPDFRFIIHNSYKVVANLPFYLTAPVIRKFLEAENPTKEMILMVQKEVAQRICAKPPDMNLLAVSVQFYSKPEIISFVSKKSFWPQPKVDTAIIKITPRQPASYRNEVSGAGFRERFFRIVKAGFSQPRKQLINNLSKGLKIEREKVKNWLLKNKIKPTQRAETLSLKDWSFLTKSFSLFFLFLFCLLL